MSFDPHQYLKTLGPQKDDDIDLGLAALSLAALTQPGISVERYTHHIKQLVLEVQARYGDFLEEEEPDSAQTQLKALKHVLVTEHGYGGDHETYDDLQNANLIRVIDRVKGLPITISILYMHVAEKCGWRVYGLDIPGHFCCSLDKGSERIIFDPFNDCKILGAADLRFMVKTARGDHAELSADYFEPVSKRAVLMRLQNNIKYRQIEGEDYAGALQTIESMHLIDPDEYRLLLDEGVLFAKTENKMAAIRALEAYVGRAPMGRDRQEALIILEQLRQGLN